MTNTERYKHWKAEFEAWKIAGWGTKIGGEHVFIYRAITKEESENVQQQGGGPYGDSN